MGPYGTHTTHDTLRTTENVGPPEKDMIRCGKIGKSLLKLTKNSRGIEKKFGMVVIIKILLPQICLLCTFSVVLSVSCVV